ncbi:KilA-N domain-containing protein [Ignavigranum ruoffiae]|uniref:KilA-N domain-containing protein n=1 Tax=Ignavigranum ruoffiae TaxID=89093 RepID=UPI0020468CD8|nr:KilA-N domain-containing protein [Ignavigranum ruoffiae]UPQ86411.1 KilA-N domain-containing protein [Ignavigranum ruoffiae]
MVKIVANGNEISILKSDSDYISLTDIAKYQDEENPRYIIQNWMRNKNTIEFLGTWENLNNENFNRVEFEAVKNEAGTNRFVLTPNKWIETVKAIGIQSKAGRYGGTYAHSDIAFEFASWISPEFKLYIIQDYQRLKQEEAYKNQLEWQTNRYISKLNYSIHTDAIKEYLITPNLTPNQIRYTYASEADMLNTALYGMTAKEFKQKYPEKEGNLRDNSTIEQLLIMNNLQNINAEMNKQKIPMATRLKELNRIAREQQNILIKNNQKALNDLKKLH